MNHVNLRVVHKYFYKINVYSSEKRELQYDTDDTYDVVMGTRWLFSFERPGLCPARLPEEQDQDVHGLQLMGSCRV